MWDWVRDQELRGKFDSLPWFEKFVLFWWAFLPFLWSKIEKIGIDRKLAGDNLSDAYIKFAKILEVLGINFESLYATLFLLVIILFLYRRDLLKAAFEKPHCDFHILRIAKAPIFVSALLMVGLFSLYLFYSHPEILSEMKDLSSSAKIPDWVFKSFKEEFTDRLIFYYVVISFAGRSGGFLLSMLFFAFSHNYSEAYILSMTFSGSFFLFLMLWSGSLSLPIVVHLLSNGAIFFWFALMT